MIKNPNDIKLLLVDDEEEFLMSSSRALGRRGFSVSVAPNGVTALEMVERNDFDVVVLDVKMPDIDGIEVFRQIRKMLPDLPVILLTGHSSIDDAFQTSKDGVADYLSKPVDIDELASRVHEIVKKQEEMIGKNGKEAGFAEFEQIIKVMLIDDETDFLDSMQRVLQRRKLEVMTAKSGREALAFLKERLVDVAVVDVKMAGMDGLELLGQIKKNFPSVEVILLTGHPSVEAAMEGIKLGASEYIKKPPEVDELVTIIRKLYRDRQETIQEQQQKLIDEIRRRFPE